MSDDFVRDLEEELAAAAQFRARRRSQRLAWPRIRARRVAAGLAATAAIAVAIVLVALALEGARDDRAADDRTPTPPGGLVVPLQPMLAPASCRDRDVRDAPAAQELPWLALLRRDQRSDDAIAPPQGNAITWIPVRSFDPAETRRAGGGGLPADVYAFPSLGVSTSGRCGAEDGPGICLVGGDEYRCFTREQVEQGSALTRTANGVAVGIVPDGIERVTLVANDRTVTTRVVENVYAARIAAPAGTNVRVIARPPDAGCRRVVAPELLDRVAALRRPPDGLVLPRAADRILDEWAWQLDAVVADGARLAGGGGGVDYWVVPVAPSGGGGCEPATGVCVLALPTGRRGAAHCITDERDLRRPSWQLAPLRPGNAALYGIVPDGITGARVTIGTESAEVDAIDNVLAGVLPFPYRDGAKVTYLRSTRAPVVVAVVDATGGDRAAAERVLGTVRDAGLGYIDGIVPGVKPQPRTTVYWDSARATRQEAESVAELVAAGDVVRIVADRAPRPVLVTEAGVVVVVGSGG